MNAQFAVQDDEVYVIEVNPRASRTVPFVAKATGVQIARLAARVMAGEEVKGTRYSRAKSRSLCREGSGFPLDRFREQILFLARDAQHWRGDGGCDDF